MEYVIGLFIFVLGAVAGSFLNVCIYRIPLGLSIVRPSSFCPLCQKSIHWYDNIPLLSFLILEGKCRHCEGVISLRYFIVELTTGLLWFGTWLFFGIGDHFTTGVILISFLLALSVIDLETGLLPDSLTITGMVFGLGLCAIFPGLLQEQVWYWSLLGSVLGVGVGVLIPYVTATLGKLIFKKKSMGGGDIKLLAMVGAFLGWKGVIIVFFLAAFFALPSALYLRIRKGQEAIHYGPFLAATAVAQFFFGNYFFKFLGW